MRFLFTLGITSFIAVANLNAAQQVAPKVPVKAAEQKQVKKQPKKQIHSSSSSSSFSGSNFAYDGAYTQNIDLDFDFTPPDPSTSVDPATGALIFDTNQPGSPRNITHPVNRTDFTRFGIEKCGTYLITWSFTIGCAAEGGNECLAGAFVQLYDAANDVALNPNPMQFIDTSSFFPLVDSEVISGQALMRLEEGVELQLRLIPAVFPYGTLWVANPSITITRIQH